MLTLSHVCVLEALCPVPLVLLMGLLHVCMTSMIYIHGLYITGCYISVSVFNQTCTEIFEKIGPLLNMYTFCFVSHPGLHSIRYHCVL